MSRPPEVTVALIVEGAKTLRVIIAWILGPAGVAALLAGFSGDSGCETCQQANSAAVIAVGLGWATAVGFAIWALAERRFRSRKTEELTARIRELEVGIDPLRSGSGLSATGDTNPEDR